MTPDEQEALSIVYAVRQNIVRLRSGNYAVFGHYDYARGTQPIAHIGDWASCEAFVTEYVPPPPRERKVVVPSALATLDLDLDL